MPEVSESKFMVQAGWNDVPHLDEDTKKELLESTPPYLREARSEGIPSLGAGAIYPVPLEEILVDPFLPPDYWPRVYALDPGWKRTAALWGALDTTADCWYLYTEHYRGQAEPTLHAAAIKARGEWIPGLIDPGARGRSQEDGRQVMLSYMAEGLKLDIAKNAVDAGIYDCWTRLSTGRIKVFRTLQNFQAEYRIYRRDEKGEVVKEFDHLMDCMRYIVLSGKPRATVKPVERERGIVTAVGDPAVGF